MDLAQCQGAHAAEFLRLAMELSMIRIVRNSPMLDPPQDRSWSEAEGLGGRNVCPPILGCVQFSAGDGGYSNIYNGSLESHVCSLCAQPHAYGVSVQQDGWAKARMTDSGNFPAFDGKDNYSTGTSPEKHSGVVLWTDGDKQAK